MVMNMSDEMTDAPIAPIDEPIAAPQQDNYWGFYATERFWFPDKVTFIEFKVMSEGDKVKFQSKTSRDVILNRAGDARLRMNQGSERHELIKTCATAWNLVRGDEIVPFSERILQQWLDVADPKIVEDLELAIRKANPWLLGEMTSEDIQKEIDNLEEMLKVAKEREAGEASSSNR